MKNEIVIYETEELPLRIEVRIDNETVWLNKEQISSLFGRDRSVISRHINNIFKEGELRKEEVCAFFAQTSRHGALKGKTQTKNVEYYKLDVIISVGYRVKLKFNRFCGSTYSNVEGTRITQIKRVVSVHAIYLKFLSTFSPLLMEHG